MKRNLIALLVAALMLVFSVSLVQAGGWAVVSLVDLPRSLEAGQTVEFQFRVLQHGKVPVPDLDTVVEARHTASGETLKVEGQYDEDAGLYRAEIAFPREGEWEWKIVAFSDHAMPRLMVSPPTQAEASKSPLWWQALLDGLMGRRSETQVSAPISSVPPADMYSSEEDYGAALFVAKGCTTCHIHSENPYRSIEGSFGYTGPGSSIGPVLTDFTSSAEYLTLWLSDPASVKPKTIMPNLELSDAEITALIAFLNAD